MVVVVNGGGGALPGVDRFTFTCARVRADVCADVSALLLALTSTSTPTHTLTLTRTHTWRTVVLNDQLFGDRSTRLLSYMYRNDTARNDAVINRSS